MAKLGTAQIEIAPHISDEALEDIASKVAAAVERGVRLGMAAALVPPKPPQFVMGGVAAPAGSAQVVTRNASPR